MNRKAGPNYQGPLAEPLEGVEQLEEIANPSDLTDAYEQFLLRTDAAILQKMFLLLDHYGISKADEEAWFYLSLCLAEDHVAGFRYASQAGRKKKWPPALDALIRVMIANFRHKHPKHSITSAAEHVSKHPALAKLIGDAKKPGEVIRQAYFRARPEFREVIHAALGAGSADAIAEALHGPTKKAVLDAHNRVYGAPPPSAHAAAGSDVVSLKGRGKKKPFR